MQIFFCKIGSIKLDFHMISFLYWSVGKNSSFDLIHIKCRAYIAAKYYDGRSHYDNGYY